MFQIVRQYVDEDGDLSSKIRDRRRHRFLTVLSWTQAAVGVLAINAIMGDPGPHRSDVFQSLIPFLFALFASSFCAYDAIRCMEIVRHLNREIDYRTENTEPGAMTLYEPRKDGVGDLEISVAVSSLEECAEAEDLKEGYKVEFSFVAPPEPEDLFPGYGEFIDEHGNCTRWVRVQDQDGNELPPMKLHNKVRRC